MPHTLVSNRLTHGPCNIQVAARNYIINTVICLKNDSLRIIDTTKHHYDKCCPQHANDRGSLHIFHMIEKEKYSKG